MDIASTVASQEAWVGAGASVGAERAPDAPSGRDPDTRRVGTAPSTRAAIARWIWVMLVVAVLVRVIVTIRIYFLEVHTPCTGSNCQGPPAMTREQMHLLQGTGVSPEVYAACCAVLLLLFIAVHCVVAGIIMWRRSVDRMTVLTAFTLTTFGGLSFGLPDQLFHQWEPAWWLPMAVLAWLGTVAITLFVYLFPDGRPVLRWPAIPLALWSVTQLATYVAPNFVQAVNRLAGPFGTPLAVAVSLGTFGSLIYTQV